MSRRVRAPEEGGVERGSRRPRRAPTWLLALLVPLCAVAPWVFPWPWQVHAAAPASDPSVYIRQATSPRLERATGVTAAAAPSAETLRAVAAELARTTTSGYDQPVSAKAAAAVRTTPGSYQKVGRIKIAAIGLDVGFGEGVYAAALDHGPGHWPGTPLPGQAGTAVLSGHRNTHTAPFKYLNRLKRGDKIITTVTGAKGGPVIFRVDDITIVPEAKYPAFVLKPAKDPGTAHLTLFACHPEGNPIYRIVVRASVAAAGEAKG